MQLGQGDTYNFPDITISPGDDKPKLTPGRKAALIVGFGVAAVLAFQFLKKSKRKRA